MPALFSDQDPWLEPYRPAIKRRLAAIEQQKQRILGTSSLKDFALGYLYFGLHRTKTNWLLREWAPNATKIVLIGECNAWAEEPEYEFSASKNGQWELRLPLAKLQHGQHYKLRVYWRGGSGDRVPSYANYVVQDPHTHSFDAVVWSPDTPYDWKYQSPAPYTPLLIYEAHVGMSSEKPEVATYSSFTRTILPRIKADGYNTVQLMAVAEHPYYGSFGYHVSNFFAVSSRFGTPNEFKELVDTAHQLGLSVILDIVHSHAAKNEVEGLSRFDGTLHQYFHKGARGDHPQWDSRVFDYGKAEVSHFLLSNCRYWLEEYNVDGFRFDGVTSMLYADHGLERSFASYDDYFGDDSDIDALTYLTMANELIHTTHPSAVTIAEDMSGMPGLAAPIQQGGVGFDYRLNMGTPDMWIKTIKEQRDEDWDLGHIFHELTSKRPEEKTITYAESHDQALVGDKTLLFRLLDAAIYDHMSVEDTDLTVERGIALIKLIKLLTASTEQGGYLNFMGNEFGHPEWIDFPREGNNWSYDYARRQWHLADDSTLKYSQLGCFDRHLLDIIKQLDGPLTHVYIDQHDHVISFMRGTYVFAFNFSPSTSVSDYSLPVKAGSYTLALSSDDTAYGGYDRIDHVVRYMSQKAKKEDVVRVYLPARTAIVLRQSD